MTEITVANWFGDIVSHPQVVVDANSVDDIVAVMKDPVKYPAPVRAVGSNHSTAACGVADVARSVHGALRTVLRGFSCMTRRRAPGCTRERRLASIVARRGGLFSYP